MTCNQLVLLGQIYRGWNPEKEPGPNTRENDLRMLMGMDLIYKSHGESFPYELTSDGRDKIDAILLLLD